MRYCKLNYWCATIYGSFFLNVALVWLESSSPHLASSMGRLSSFACSVLDAAFAKEEPALLTVRTVQGAERAVL